MREFKNTTAIILAGGQSTRMGEDKGLMNLGDKPMIQYILETVSKLTDQIIIVANNSDYEKFGYPVFKDIEQAKGPLGGIVTGLTASKTALNWIISCDSPHVTIDLLKVLMLKLKNVEAVVPERAGKIHPLIAAYQKSSLAFFKKELALNHLKLMPIIDKLDVRIMGADHFDRINFKNLNSKEDL